MDNKENFFKTISLQLSSAQEETLKRKRDSTEDINLEPEDLPELKRFALNDFNNLQAPKFSKQVESNTSVPTIENISDSEDEIDIHAIRELNKRKIAAFFEALRKSEIENGIISSNSLKPRHMPKFIPRTPKYKPAYKKNKDLSVHFQIKKSMESRRSARLQNKKPEYKEHDLDNIQENVGSVYFKNSNSNNFLDDIEHIEDVVYKPKKFKIKLFSKAETRTIIPVEEVTPDMIKNIAKSVKTKVKSQINGTTCHQCRQKTMDQKTCCRGPDCTGGYGMFCGVCLRNRYGENCEEALLNPNWICPVCRGICNCSICRYRQGKRPTGVLAPIAFEQGHQSVAHYLKSLKGEGDIPEDDYKYKYSHDSEALLGFSDDGRKVHLQEKSYLAFCTSCSLKDCDQPENLLGFSVDGKMAVMGGGRYELLGNQK